MDDPSNAPAPAPRTPYREGVPLAEIIPPDRRHLKAAALVVTSMVAGAALWALGSALFDLKNADPITRPAPPPIPTGYPAGRVGPATLDGPAGRFAVPGMTRMVVNVWLQGCSDCMPAFDAMAALQDEGGLGAHIPILNVAYGEADPAWARRYGVASGLVFDAGGRSIVKPLGIGTFTTLVVEPDGSIIHRDRPDKPGYAERLRAFFSPEPAPYRASPDDPFATPPAQPLGADAVQRVVAAQSPGLRRTCWENEREGASPRTVTVTAKLTIERDGHVSASSTGRDTDFARCVERQTRAWRFPAGTSTTTVSIPFNFVRE